MKAGIHNFSEIGKLNKVLLHRPGKELEALTPATMGRLLFDDIPYLKVAQDAPGKVVTYERNNVSNYILDKKGIEVLTMPSSELSRGRGGPRCMSCPVQREDL